MLLSRFLLLHGNRVQVLAPAEGDHTGAELREEGLRVLAWESS